MVHQFNEDGSLDISALDAPERRKIVEDIQNIIWDAEAEWEASYGPFERLYSIELDASAMQARLDSVDPRLIWADVNFYGGFDIYPTEGLSLTLKGWAKVASRNEWRDEGDDFLIASKPWPVGEALNMAPIFSLARCICPFCAEDDVDSLDCDICEGEEELEFEN